MNVLIVDDDIVDTEHVCRILNNSNGMHNISRAENVDESIEKCLHNDYDIIFLDYSLPGRDGIELVYELRKKMRNNNAAIVMMSNCEDESLTKLCIQAGAHDFVSKSELTESRIRNCIINARTRFQLEKEVKESQEQIRKLAQLDGLTGLLNRSFFEEQLKNSIEYAKRNKRILGLLILDLDNFKYVNDSFGHDFGDELLRRVTTRIKGCLRSTEIFARLGGDEFAILCPEMTDITAPSHVATRILRVLTLPLTLNGVSASTGASIGISILEKDGDTAEDLIKNADIAMYRAKKSGKNSFFFFEEKMHTQVLERISIEKELKDAIIKNEFIIHYQPVYSLEEEKVTQLEALVRWQKKDQLLYPDKFINIAESTGDIVQLGRWVISKVCHDLPQIKKNTHNNIRVAINLSPVQLVDKSLIPHIKNCLEKNNLSATNLDIELTETSLLNNSGENIRTIKKIGDMGCQISLDDFGTGYSSISHLQEFPITTVKIDRSMFPQENDVDIRRKLLLLKGLVYMIRTLNLDIIAEGIETKEHISICKGLSVNNLQGYYFSRPHDIKKISQILKNNKWI